MTLEMYQIALCDDIISELEKIETLLGKYKEINTLLKYKSKRFENAQLLVDKIHEKNYLPDLLLIDVIMKEKTGLEAVKEIRKEGYDIPVIFLTASTEYALEAYQVDALQYLVKPLNKDRFFHAMDIAFEVIRKEEKNFVVIKTSNGLRQVHQDQIIYCETQKNYQILHIEGEQIKVRMTSGELYEILGMYPQFLKCGSSYVLNLNHIITMNREEIHVDNGDKIYLPRNRVTEFKKKYFAFYFDKY